MYVQETLKLKNGLQKEINWYLSNRRKSHKFYLIVIKNIMVNAMPSSLIPFHNNNKNIKIKYKKKIKYKIVS